jgi:hypothetical protein
MRLVDLKGVELKLKSQLIALAAVAALGATGNALAAATIKNSAGTVALGINELGNLNTTEGSVAVNASGYTGLAFKFADGTFRDATAPGCLCEGWGVSAGTATGYANVSQGTAGLTLNSFTATDTTATSVVSLTGLNGLEITQEYAEAAAAPGALFRNRVTISNNTGDTVNDVRYVRVMDWDVPLTEFNEFVTIQGTGTTSLLEKSHDNGFNTANPLADNGALDRGCVTTDRDFTDCGPSDHGAYFRFNFGELKDGESYSFDIFYGATANEREALAAMAAVGIELYSLGQSSAPTGDPVLGTPATYIFGFSGVGGVPVVPVSAPGTLALAGLALLGLGAASRRRQG